MAPTKTFNIVVNIIVKRSSKEVQLADQELTRLHGYIQDPTNGAWARQRIEKITEMLLLPSTTDAFSADLQKKIHEVDASEDN